MKKGLAQISVQKVTADNANSQQTDLLAVEEPLEIRLGFYNKDKFSHQAISITMRTPGHDFELAAGFLFTEGIVRAAEQISGIKHCGTRGQAGFENTVRIDLERGVKVDFKRLERHFYTSSSCGVCGKSSIEALQTGVKKVDSRLTIKSVLIHDLPEILRQSQMIFDQTGGLHASALFDEAGSLEIVREDVGRHNALDKVIGAGFLKNETPLSDKILLVSGRASFELVQKALMAGIPILAAVGSPSSLAVELAREFGMTLIGFVRDNRFNIYTGEGRVI
jgi:FdhD protein